MTTSIGTLARELPTGHVVTDPDVMERYRRDTAPLPSAGHPRAVIVARSVGDVQATLALAHEARIPVVPRGGGSGLSGGANAIDGCFIVALELMSEVLDVDAANLQVTVEAGVLTASLKEHARSANLFYPPDPASSAFCTVGGNIATNAGGLCCVKYGVTRDFVLTLDVVLADGSLLQTGSLTRKSVVGYDLTGLMVGSEGTLGVVTSATLRLVPQPQSPATVVATFGSLDRVGELPTRLAESGITPAMLEIMDRRTIGAVEDCYRMGLDRSLAAIVVAQTDTWDRQRESESIATVAERLGASEVFCTIDELEGDMLIQARKLAYTALERSNATALLDDVAVPLSRLPDLIRKIDLISENHSLPIATFGHLGDGNLHPTLLYDHHDESENVRAGRAFEDIIEATLDLDGTVTGEHGVGLLKRDHILKQLGASAARANWDIKNALDPRGILNPGKAIPQG